MTGCDRSTGKGLRGFPGGITGGTRGRMTVTFLIILASQTASDLVPHLGSVPQ
jgi:hypothetical protein